MLHQAKFQDVSWDSFFPKSEPFLLPLWSYTFMLLSFVVCIGTTVLVVVFDSENITVIFAIFGWQTMKSLITVQTVAFAV
jgi:hypothetical protein